MSKVFNMVGGGSKNISSIIITGLESTDTVTCTKDGKSYTATWDSTAQHWEIVGLPLGAFTVTATNGTDTKTKTVLIDISGVYEVKMAFKLWLYKDGDPCEVVSGGWVKNGYSVYGSGDSAATKNATSMRFYTSANSTANILGTNIGFDASYFTKIKVACNVVQQKSYGDFNVYLRASSKTGRLIANKATTTKGEQTLTVNIPANSESCYLMLSAMNATMEATVSKVWLE